jgi:hypothetical protein
MGRVVHDHSLISYRNAFTATTVLVLVVAAAFGTYYFQTLSTLNQMQTRDAYYQTQLQALQKQLNAIQSNSTLSRTLLTEQLSSIQSKIENLINGSQAKFSQQLAALMFEVNDVQETLPCANTQLKPATHFNYSNATATVPVLLMNPASTLTVCVTWQATPIPNGTAGYYIYSHAHALNFSLEVVHNMPCTPAPPPGTTCFFGVTSHSFVITTIPSRVPLNPYISNFVTLYQITALGNSTGFYEQALPDSGICSHTPLVVGYKPSQVNTTDFYGYPPPFLCQEFPFYISETIVGGFSNIILLNFPYR